MTTNVPPVKFTLTGLVLPTEQAILAGIQADINTAFGGGVNPALETPQGQLASSEAAIIGEANGVFAQIVNQVDPAYSAGRMQDAIGRIYFITRKPSVPTVVACTCVGLVGVLIPTGALAVDEAGNLYACVTGATIPIGGSISLQFAGVVPGPIPCPANSLNRIYTALPGWDTITNPLEGIAGSDVETRADFEFRRQNSVALNGHGTLPSIYGEVFSVDNVLDVFVTENVTGSSVDVGATNYTLAPHSIYVAVVGGDLQEIAEAIWRKKDAGCNYNGNTTRTVYDMSGYDSPYPSYDVIFEIPAALPIYIDVTIENDPNLPANITALIKTALLNAFVGGDGGRRARIASVINAYRFVAPVIMQSPFVRVESIFVGTAAMPTGVDVFAGIDQRPTLVAGHITVTLV